MDNHQAILDVVKHYQDAIHTQNREDFIKLWSHKVQGQLISITHLFQGVENIADDFLCDRIHTAYSKIDLIADHIEINQVSEDLAIVVFSYHTDCIKRDTNEPYGFPGLETQVLIKEEGLWKLVHVHYSK